MTGYVTKFEENRMTMSLMIKYKQLLENYNKIWKKNEKKVAETTYGDDDDKYIKAKIKTYKIT